MKIILALLVLMLGAASAAIGQDTSHPLGSPDVTTGNLGVQQKSEAGQNKLFERVLEENSGTAVDCVRITTGSANTPVPVATATPTAGATTPTMTPNGGTTSRWKWCYIRSSPENTGVVYWDKDANVSASTGMWLYRGEWVRKLSALEDGTCPYSVVSDTASQAIGVCYER